MNTFFAAIAASLVLAFCLWSLADPAFAEDRDVVIQTADGQALEIPYHRLSEREAGTLVGFFEWVFDTRMTSAERESFERELSRSWDADWKAYSHLVVLSEIVDQSSADNRERIRREWRPRIAAMYGEGTEMRPIVDAMARRTGESAAENEASTGSAGIYSGLYSASVPGGAVLLELKQSEGKNVSGLLRALGGAMFRIQATVKPDGHLEGVAHGDAGKLAIDSQLTLTGLRMRITETDSSGKAVPAKSKDLNFARAAAHVPAPASQPKPPALTASQNHLLQGMYCSFAGASGYSRSTRAYFDGRGQFRYSSEAYSTGPSGQAWGGSPGESGQYQVQGNQILVRFNDGSSGVARVYERAANSTITAVQYDGKIYARVLCE